MSYISAEDVLPKEVIERIQQYVSGTTLYIPCKEKKNWGSESKAKQYYITRNQDICKKYRNGVTVKMLAEEYSLSIKSIQRIIRTTTLLDFEVNDDRR